jgi:hypothetical protein
MRASRVLVLVALAGCGKILGIEDIQDDLPDAGADAELDVVTPPDVDERTDAAPDAQLDATGPDARLDAPAEAAPDAPRDVASDASVGILGPCLGPVNVVYFDGDSTDYIHPGIATITAATWTTTAAPSGSTQPYTITVHLVPTQSAQGAYWDLEFSSQHLNQPLATMVYTNAERAPFATDGHPGLEITGDSRGCNTIGGAFQIEDLILAGSNVKSFTASFEQHCENGSAALRGCVHVTPP